MRRLKEIVRTMPLFGRVATRAADMLRHWRFGAPSEWLDDLIQAETATVVQIGSNDGRTNDPIFPLLQKHLDWNALFVEPVPYLFARLKKNYGEDTRFRFVNAAINDGTKSTFYWVDEAAKEEISYLPAWYDQLGSFRREHIVTHLDGVLEPYIRSTEVCGIRLPDLLRREAVCEVDILHVDTEGSDWDIISQLELEHDSPKVILYEHKHLVHEQLDASLRFLQPHYEVYPLGDDFLSVRKDIAEFRRPRLHLLRSHRMVSGTFAMGDDRRVA